MTVLFFIKQKNSGNFIKTVATKYGHVFRHVSLFYFSTYNLSLNLSHERKDAPLL